MPKRVGWEPSIPREDQFQDITIHGTLTFGAQGAFIAPATPGTFITGNLNNILFVDGVKYATIAAAITAANALSPKGIVVVPSTFGAEAITVPPPVIVLDFRSGSLKLYNNESGNGALILDKRTGAGIGILASAVDGDTHVRWLVEASGAQSWGPGNAATDIAIARGGQGVLQIDSNGVGNTTSFVIHHETATNPTDIALRSKVISEADNRWIVLKNGDTRWGDGTNSPDVRLYRDSADNLKTDDTFTALRYKAAGTALVAGDFALSAGWGNTASVGSLRGTDQFHELTITSAGTGQGASPTLTLTYKDGTWSTAPVVRVNRQEFASQATVTFGVTTQSATQYVLTFNGTPVAAETYRICVFVGGI